MVLRNIWFINKYFLLIFVLEALSLYKNGYIEYETEHDSTFYFVIGIKIGGAYSTRMLVLVSNEVILIITYNNTNMIKNIYASLPPQVLISPRPHFKYAILK